MTNENDLTLREAAARIRMAPETVRGWITDLPPHRRLVATQIGPQGRYRIRLADLETFLERR